MFVCGATDRLWDALFSCGSIVRSRVCGWQGVGRGGCQIEGGVDAAYQVAGRPAWREATASGGGGGRHMLAVMLAMLLVVVDIHSLSGRGVDTLGGLGATFHNGAGTDELRSGIPHL